MSWGELEELLMDESVVLNEFDYCHTHKKQCRRVPEHGNGSATKDYLDILVAGSPCPDFSSFGKHNGQSGETSPAFMTLTLRANIGELVWS